MVLADAPTLSPMRNPIAPLAAGLFCASLCSLSGQTFTEDVSGTPANNTFNRVDGLPLGEILFNNVEGGSISNPYEINPVGATITKVTTGSGATVTAFDICSEMFVGPAGSSSYSLAEGMGSLNAGQQTLVTKLFSNTLSGFFTTYNTPGPANRTQAAIIGAALQLALWEIVEDPDALATPSLDESQNPGEVSISGFSGSYSGDTKAAMELAQTYLTSLSGWNDEGGVNFYYADPGSDQDRLWVTMGAQIVPEPSTMLLGLTGLAFLLRRRRD